MLGLVPMLTVRLMDGLKKWMPISELFSRCDTKSILWKLDKVKAIKLQGQ